MRRKDLEELREKVSCSAVLETDGWKIDRKESSKSAVKCRRGEGEIVIVTHAGKGWFDPMSDAKGDVFGLSKHLSSFGFVEALERVVELVGFVPSQPIWRKPVRHKGMRLSLRDGLPDHASNPFSRLGAISARSAAFQITFSTEPLLRTAFEKVPSAVFGRLTKTAPDQSQAGKNAGRNGVALRPVDQSGCFSLVRPIQNGFASPKLQSTP
jgi:hypothetical protein